LNYGGGGKREMTIHSPAGCCGVVVCRFGGEGLGAAGPPAGVLRRTKRPKKSRRRRLMTGFLSDF